MYAVLNALRLTHGIRTLKARDVFNSTLMGLIKTPAVFKAVLDQTTDYIQLVDAMLENIKKQFPLEINRPFDGKAVPSVDQLWSMCSNWLNNGDRGRAIIFRFLRNLKPNDKPVNRHWTTADKIDENILHLFDCSHEAEAILNVRKDSFVTRQSEITQEKLLYIQPETIRFLRLPF